MRSEACPRCEAPVGEACTRENGKFPPFRGWVHRERVVMVRLGMTPAEILEQARRTHQIEKQRQEIVEGTWMPDGYVLNQGSDSCTPDPNTYGN